MYSKGSQQVSGNLLEENLKKAVTEMTILYLLSEKDCYVGELTAALQERSGGVLSIVFPYGAIYRLENAGHIYEVAKRIAPDSRRRQYFRITDAGREHLKRQLETYKRFTGGLARVLEDQKEGKDPK